MQGKCYYQGTVRNESQFLAWAGIALTCLTGAAGFFLFIYPNLRQVSIIMMILLLLGAAYSFYRALKSLRPAAMRHKSPALIGVAFLNWTQTAGSSYAPGERAGFTRETAERLVATGAARFCRRRDRWIAAYRTWRHKGALSPL